jgi:hypothetical protein
MDRLGSCSEVKVVIPKEQACGAVELAAGVLGEIDFEYNLLPRTGTPSGWVEGEVLGGLRKERKLVIGEERDDTGCR